MTHRPDGRTSVASNFLIRLRASVPWGMSVRTAELQHAISISAMRASGPWEAVVQTVEVESAISILIARPFGPRLTDVRTGYYIVRTVERSFLYRNLERIWDWSSTERRSDGLLRRPDGCKLDRNFSTQWRVRTKVHVVRTNDAWSDCRPNGMARCPDRWNSGQMCIRTGWLDRPDGWQGTEIFDLSLSAKSSESVLKVESLFTASLHTQVILSKHRIRPKY
jgi:hypothetical protein